MSTTHRAERPTTPPPPDGEMVVRRSFHFPSAFAVLFGVTIVVWLLAFVIPSGTYQTDADSGRPIPGTYATSDSGLSFGDRLMDLFMAPVNGLYGILNPDGRSGRTSPVSCTAPPASSCSSWPSACSSPWPCAPARSTTAWPGSPSG